MLCQSCGNQISEGSKFCKSCGCRIEKSSSGGSTLFPAPATTAVIPIASASAAAVPAADSAVSPYAPRRRDPLHKKAGPDSSLHNVADSLNRGGSLVFCAA